MIGQQVGNYKVISQIGAGGMGEVFLAEHVTIGTRVAIKVLQATISKDGDQVNRFFNEAKAVSKVRHAGPVKIFDCGYHEQSGQRVAYLAMEFLEGESLAARIKRLGTLPGEQVADIGRQIAGVLDAVHSAGITHRDLKPDNIFLVPDHELPSGERVKVLDFGIAKLTGTHAGPQTKGTMGTPAYMAPEQWNNASSVDGKADTYSLGCVMFEMAVGRPPFPSQSIGEACNHHLNSKPPRASEVMRSIPAEFDTLVDRMLSKTSGERPTVKEVAHAFDTLRSSGVTQRWHAAAVTGVATTLGPGSMPPLGSPAGLGSQPGATASGQYGSQPGYGYGSQPGAPSGQYGSQPGQIGSQPGHVPGMHNPLATPVPQHHTPQHGPSASYQAQGQSAPYQAQSQSAPYQAQGQSAPYQAPGQSAPYPVQHATPLPPPHYTPQHPTPPPGTHPPQAKSNKGLVIGLAAVVLVGGGVAAAVVATSGGDSSPDKVVGGDKTAVGNEKAGDKTDAIDKTSVVDKTSEKLTGAVSDKGATEGSTVKALIGGTGSAEADKGPAKPPASKRDDIVAKNAFVDRYGVRVMSSQITAREYELVIGSVPADITKPADPEAPLPSLTQQEAASFCAAIGARLPTSDEWAQASKGAWGIAVDAVAGPLQEWTSTIQDELVVVRGGHSAMPQASLDKAGRSRPPYFLQKEVAGATFDRKVVSAPTIGFRCVDGAPKTTAEAAPGTPATPGVGFVRPKDKPGLGNAATTGQGGRVGSTGTGGIGTLGKGTGTGGRLGPPSNNVRVGDTSINGRLPAEMIKRGISQRIGAIKACYEKELRNNPALAGRVETRFTIGVNGAVTAASATGMDPVVSDCIVRVIRMIQFPTPEGGVVVVSYPLVFNPG